MARKSTTQGQSSWKAGVFLLSLVAVVVLLFWINPFGGKQQIGSAEGRAERERKAQENAYLAGFTLAAGKQRVGWEVPKGSNDTYPIVYIWAKFPVMAAYVSDRWGTSDEIETTPDQLFKRVMAYQCDRDHFRSGFIRCDHLDTSAHGYFLLIRDERPADANAPPNEIHVDNRWGKK